MKEYIEWLENKIEVCLEDKDLQREHWAFCQALKKMRELQLLQADVSGCKTIRHCRKCYKEVSCDKDFCSQKCQTAYFR